MNRLERWRLDQDMSYADIHRRLGISTPGMICRWCMHPDHKSYQEPSEDEKMFIQMMTFGAVPANTWTVGQPDVSSAKPKGGSHGRKS